MRRSHKIGIALLGGFALAVGAGRFFDKGEDLSIYGPMPCEGRPFVPTEVMRGTAEMFMRDKIPATSILGPTAMQCVGQTPRVLDVCAEVVSSNARAGMRGPVIYGRLHAFDAQPFYETVITDPTRAAEACGRVMPQLEEGDPSSAT